MAPRLKLHGPRRPQSARENRTNQTSPTAPSPLRLVSNMEIDEEASKIRLKLTTSTSKSESPAASVESMPGDTIRVHHKHAAPEIATVTDGGRTEDLEMIDADDDEKVEEYDFTNEVETEEAEDNDHDTDFYKSSDAVITISSDEDTEKAVADVDWRLSDRPWKEAGFGAQIRYQYETMFSIFTTTQLQGDWETTELYQLEKDKQMMRYLEDYPLHNWVIPQERAAQANRELKERNKWRSMGVPIYERERVPGMFNGTGMVTVPQHQAMRMNAPLNVASCNHARRSDPSAGRTSYAQSHNGTPTQGSVPASALPRVNSTPSHSRALPEQVLPSQPNAQPLPKYPNGMPIYPTVNGPSLPSYINNLATPAGGRYPSQGQQGPSASQSSRRKPRERTIVTPPPETGSVRVPTPPYEKQEKPIERTSVNKSGRKNMRRQAEAEEFPWHRDIDFRAARAEATWDDSIFDPVTLQAMELTRKRNEQYMKRVDTDETDRQRQSRSERKAITMDKTSSDAEVPKRRPGGRKPSDKSGGNTSDPYHSGHFGFVDQEGVDKAAEHGKTTPDEVMEAAELQQISLDECAKMMISWNPGKKGHTEELEQGQFSIRDNLLTRQQIATTMILTRRAAECIVDFCPDLLWREMLLRIISEAGYGNKEVRDRMCYNGNYCDKATITKRIGAALGQKQVQSNTKRRNKVAGEGTEKLKGYMPGEDNYFNRNVKDHHKYMAFFGQRTSHRGQLTSGTKRKFGVDGSDEVSGESGAEEGVKVSGGLAGEVDIGSDLVEDTEDEVSDSDAVSIQSDTLLDEMDED